MSYKIANAQVWVHDQDEALAFYTQKLGMEVRADVTLPELGGFRWLTVGPHDQPDFSIVLMAIPGPPGGAPVRDRLRLPRPVRQRLPPHAGARGDRGVRAARRSFA
jgi:catechol 2,3-dioxygenase-like lactoylglutathione lyase family enzyme